jgi:choline dehydrogenase-like flavoprotein
VADRAEVLVIGGGAAGAVVSLALARAGVKVVCLEQGGWPDRSLYRGDQADWELVAAKQMAFSPNVRANPADYPIVDDDSDAGMLMYNAVGGSTIVYNAVFPRLLPTDFRVRSLDGVADDWPVSYEELLPYYRESERQFAVSGLVGDPAYPDEDHDLPLPPLPLGNHGLRMARAHNELGWHWWPQPNAIPSQRYGGLNACAQRGTCTAGCPEGAKATVDVTHWPEALRLGVDLRTGARVTRVVTGADGLATGAEYLDREGVLHFQAADVCILAANAVGTARLLLMSAGAGHPDGLANSSGLVGRRLMVHPAARVLGFFDEHIDSWQGQAGGAITSLQFYDTAADRGFVRGAKWTLTPGGGPVRNALRIMDQGGWGPAHHELFGAQFGHGATWSVFAEDLPEDRNRVTLEASRTDSDGLPAARISYKLSDNSRRLLEFNVDRAVESFQVARAHHVESEILPKMPGWHAMGTARMGNDPGTSVVDRFGRSHDVPNLFVADASTFVTAGAVNPTNTLAALALRTVDHLLAGRRNQQVPA